MKKLLILLTFLYACGPSVPQQADQTIGRTRAALTGCGDDAGTGDADAGCPDGGYDGGPLVPVLTSTTTKIIEILRGQSEILGGPTTSGAGLSTTVLNAGTRRAKTSLCSAHEGTTLATCGNSTNVESPLTAGMDTWHACDPYGRTLVGEKSALGGTPFSSRNKGTATYAAAYGVSPNGYVKQAYDALGAGAVYGWTMLGDGFNDGAIGNCDPANLAAYYDLVVQDQIDVETDIKAITHQYYPPVYFISPLQSDSGALSSTWNSACAIMQYRLALYFHDLPGQAYMRGFLLPPSDPHEYIDSAHRKNVSSREWGEEQGWAKCMVAARGEDYRFYPGPGHITATATSVVFDYTGRVPCASPPCTAPFLAFDTTTVTLAQTGDQGSPLYGFELPCGRDTVNPPILTGVHIEHWGGGRVLVVGAIDRPLPAVGCEGALGVSGSNGPGVTQYRIAKVNARATSTFVGPRSGATRYLYANKMREKIEGTTATVASTATSLDDKSWTFLFAAGNDGPAAGSAWASIEGSASVPYSTGTWTLDGDMSPFLNSALRSDRVSGGLKPNKTTPGCWTQTGTGNHVFDRLATQDLRIKIPIKTVRPAADEYLIKWKGDTNGTSTNQWYVRAEANGSLRCFWGQGQGAILTNAIAAGTSSTAGEVECYHDAKAGAAGTTRGITLCFRGMCTAAVSSAIAAANVGGNLSINGKEGCASRSHAVIGAIGIMIGEQARAQTGGVEPEDPSTGVGDPGPSHKYDHARAF